MKMDKQEKVIRGLECVICPNRFCGNCMYFVRNENDPDMGWCDRDASYRDALELLKAREAVRWIKISPAGIYECSGCGQNVMTRDIDAYKYCHGCGKRVKWE